MNDGGIYALVKLPNVGFWLRLLKNSAMTGSRLSVVSMSCVFLPAATRWPGEVCLFGV